jgi:hypothetical protein
MFSTLSRKFGIPGVISVIALVFALAGGAIAANGNGGATASKTKVKKVKGPRGPQGPAGPQGVVGPQGIAGANGKDGANGVNGKSVAVTEIEEGEAGCEELGGAAVEQEGSGAEVEVCNGSPWTAGGVLPSGQTETGTWGAWKSNNASISFPVPLSAALPETGIVKIAKEATPPEECDNGEGAAPTVSNPEADPGFLCIFTGEGAQPNTTFSGGAVQGAGTTGAVFLWFSEQAGSFGTFAVTAP